MNILNRKGVLHREKYGRAWRYWPVESRSEHDARLMGEVLAGSTDRCGTMRRFIERFSDEEVSLLRTTVSEVIAGRGAAS